MPDVPAMIEVFIIVDLFYILLNLFCNNIRFVCLFIYDFFFRKFSVNKFGFGKWKIKKKGVYCLLFLYGGTNQKV